MGVFLKSARCIATIHCLSKSLKGSTSCSDHLDTIELHHKLADIYTTYAAQILFGISQFPSVDGIGLSCNILLDR